MTVVVPFGSGTLNGWSVRRVNDNGRERTLRAALLAVVESSVSGDASTEQNVWDCQLDGRPVWVWAALYALGRGTCMRDGFQYTWGEIRANVYDGLAPQLGEPTFDHDAECSVIRFSWEDGTWLAFEQAPVLYDLGRPDLWRALEEWPEFEPVTSGSEPEPEPESPESEGSRCEQCGIGLGVRTYGAALCKQCAKQQPDPPAESPGASPASQATPGELFTSPRSEPSSAGGSDQQGIGTGSDTAAAMPGSRTTGPVPSAHEGGSTPSSLALEETCEKHGGCAVAECGCPTTTEMLGGQELPRICGHCLRKVENCACDCESFEEEGDAEGEEEHPILMHFCPLCAVQRTSPGTDVLDACPQCGDREYFATWAMSTQPPEMPLREILAKHGVDGEQTEPWVCSLCQMAMGNGTPVRFLPNNRRMCAHQRCLETGNGRCDEPPIKGINGEDPRDPCSWHPGADREARAGDPWHARADVIAGSGRKRRRLCYDCTKLKRFSRVRKFVEITR